MKKLLLIALLPLAGCATQATRPTAKDDPSAACLRSLFVDGRYALMTRTDTAFPTDEEKNVISQWAAARQQCIALGASFRQQYAPASWRAAFDDGQSSVTRLSTQLFSGQITYGEFSMKRAEVGAIAQSRFAESDQQESLAAAAVASADATRRQAAGVAIMQNIQAQQAIQAQQPIYQPVPTPALRLPTTTNCQRWGNQVNCTTY